MIMRSGWGGVRLSGLFFLEGRRGGRIAAHNWAGSSRKRFKLGGVLVKDTIRRGAPDMTTSSTALFPFEFHNHPHHNQAEDFHLRSQKEKKNVYT